MKEWFKQNWKACIPGFLFMVALFVLPYACPNKPATKEKAENYASVINK